MKGAQSAGGAWRGHGECAEGHGGCMEVCTEGA